MAWYIWSQQEGGEESWTLDLAEQRERIIKERQPQFTTILDADNNFKGEMRSEDLEKVHYRGPFYVDFDSASLEEVIPQFRKFLNKLKEDHQFNPAQAQLFASGGKGFHCIIPSACFLPKAQPKGFMHLPHIYKEIALELYVDTLDMRVYTARRGRQFRTANVKRSNGNYKVPITVQEAMEMTPETYRELVSAPRHIGPADPAELNSSLALLFASAHDKVEQAMKNRKKSKVDVNLLKRFGGDVPPSILTVMNGEHIASGIGFQRIATQLSIAAHALGKTEEQFLALCAGLCENHQSDGNRYNTPAKRRQELSRMWQYMRDNPCYDFSIGGIKSLIDGETKTPDLDNGGHDLGDDERPEDDELDWSLTQGMKVSTNGIFKKTDEGLQKVCAVGLSNPCQLVDVRTERVLGYQVNVHLDGHDKGPQVLDMSMFLSRAKFMQFTLSVGGSSMTASDAQVGAIADILRTRAKMTGSQVYTTGREGLDVVLLPNGEMDVIWADRFGVMSKQGLNYRLVGALTEEGEYKTDLRHAPALTDTEETRTFFRHLFHVNKPEIVGRMLGWYAAAFFTQPIRHIFDQFPLMQVFGPAGSGKTGTNRLFLNMHYYKAKARTQSIQGLTPFATEALVSGSASVPLILDEFKPREMRKDRLDRAKEIIRTNYNGETITKGRLNTEGGGSRLDLRDSRNAAPVVFIGEAIESQSAILDRCVMVSMSKEGKRGHAGDFGYCTAYKEVLSQFGRLCMDAAMNVNFEKLRETLLGNLDKVVKLVGERADDSNRPVYNMAVVLTGLEFARKRLNKVFGDLFDEEIDRLVSAIVGHTEALIPRVMSEASKVLDTFSYLSRNNESEPLFKLEPAADYITIGPHIEICMRQAYTKYVRFKRSLGEEVLYDTLEAFLAAMSVYGGMTDQFCMDSPIKGSPSNIVFQFSREFLTSDGVGEFR